MFVIGLFIDNRELFVLDWGKWKIMCSKVFWVGKIKLNVKFGVKRVKRKVVVKVVVLELVVSGYICGVCGYVCYL